MIVVIRRRRRKTMLIIKCMSDGLNNTTEWGVGGKREEGGLRRGE